MTSATLRDQAYAAATACEWALAAKLYALAADSYTGKGALAQMDIARLRERAKNCAETASEAITA